MFYSSTIWLTISSDLGLYGDESWFNYSIPKLYKHKIEHHFKYNYHRLIGWAVYTLYCCFGVFYVPFYSMADITGGRNGLISDLNLQGLASILIVIFTNWSILFIHFRLINMRVIFYFFVCIIFVVFPLFLD